MTNPPGPRILFMGSPAFAVPSLRAIAAAGYEIAAVVTQPDRPAGRGGALRPPDVKVAALELGLPVYQPETLKDPAVHTHLASFQADLYIVAAYGRILPRAVLDLPAHGCINVHASLLPRWRGSSPINAAILAGDSETGVSIMQLVLKMDAGPVITTAATPILPTDTAATLEPRLAALGAETLVRTLPRWLADELPAQPQDEALVTYCHIIKKEDGHLSAAMTAEEAERAVRAYNPWPGAYVLHNGQRLAIWRAHVSPAHAAPAGTPAVIERAPAVAFATGALVLDELQKPGGKRLSGQQFLAGERGAFSGEISLSPMSGS